jgi:hypothetical protein
VTSADGTEIGQGHDAVDAAPVTLAGALDGFFLS